MEDKEFTELTIHINQCVVAPLGSQNAVHSIFHTSHVIV